MSELNQETSGAAESTAEETVVTENGGESNASETPTESGAAEGEATAETEVAQEEPEFLEVDGKKTVPYERFTQLNERMKKAEEANQILETLRTDPEARKQFFGEQGSEKASPAQISATPPVDPVAKFIAESVPEEGRQHYQGLVGAIESKLDAKYEQKFNESMAPIMKFIGNAIIKESRTSLPEFTKYEGAIMKLMTANPYLDVTAAYKQLRYDDLVKAQTLTKQTIQHKNKLTKTPLNKNPNASTGTPAPKKAGSFNDAFNRAWDKTTGA